MGVENLKSAQSYLELLESTGRNAYFTGGTVRDLLLFSNASDYDIATNLLPEETAAILESAGLETDLSAAMFGCVSTSGNADMPPAQITTFRREIRYVGRKPICEFIDDIYEDSLRRDFTINALYMDKKGGLLDFHHGKEDLDDGIVRFIGDPSSRIKEDPLRILRFFRFACRLGFRPAYETAKAIGENMELLSSLSPERIRLEMEQIVNLLCKECLEFINSYKLLETLFGATSSAYDPVTDLEGLIVHLVRDCGAEFETVTSAVRLSKYEKNRIRERCDVYCKG